MVEPAAGKTIPIPGPRLVPAIIISIPWVLIWYGGAFGMLENLLKYGSGTLVRGQGFVPGSMPPVLSWIIWAVFTLFPLPFVRFFVWNALGWEYVTITGSALVIERRLFGLPLYLAESYSLSGISGLRSEGPPPKRAPDWPDMLRPSNRGAIAFDHDGKTVHFGYSLLMNQELAQEISAGLAQWVARVAAARGHA